MRKNWWIVGLVLISPMLISSDDGVAEGQNKDRTGAPGSQAGCGTFSCHDDNQFAPQISFSLLEMDGETPVSEYIPGQTYVMRYTINSVGASVHGFQSTALLENDFNAGTFTNPGAFTQLEAVNGRHIFEHSAPNPSEDFFGEWIAPPTGSGPVTFYAAGLAANGNGNKNGDGFAGNVVETIPELGSSVDEYVPGIEFSLFERQLFVQVNEETTYQIFSLNGALVKAGVIVDRQETIDLQELKAGVFVLNLSNGEYAKSTRILLQ